MNEKSILEILGGSCTLEILMSLAEKPKRFIDLEDVCRSRRTRSARLKELEKKKLVRTVPKMVGKRAYTFYEITPLGVRALELCKSLLYLDSKVKEQDRV